MMRKSFTVFMAVCLVLVATVVPAFAKPEPPAPMGAPASVPGIDMANAPEAVKAAASLQTSLTADQQAAVGAVLDKYLPELKAITDVLFAASKRGAAGAELQRMDPVMVERQDKLNAAIEAEISALLTADQLALFKTVLHAPVGIEMTKIEGISSPDGYTSNCWYAPYYDAYAMRYGYYAYLYSYYNYLYGGGSYKYSAYVYSYNGYLYAKYALDYAGPLYFTLYYTSAYWTNYPYYSYYYASYAYQYAYYGYLYSYYNYSASSSSYAYYAYQYGYNSYYYSYYGYYYGYYCYYYI